MNVFWLLAIVVGIGALGGFLTSVLAGELHFPRFDARSKIWRPGWIGNVLLGGAAAFVNWAANSTLGEGDFYGTTPLQLHFTLGQAGCALLVGLIGGRYLTEQSRRHILQHKLDEEMQARLDTAAFASQKANAHADADKPGDGS